MPPQEPQLDVMAGRSPLLLLWAPSRLVRELRNFLVPEVQEQYHVAAMRRAAGGSPLPPPPPPLALQPLGDDGAAWLARVVFCSEASDQHAAAENMQREVLLEAARGCTLVSTVLQPLAAAPTPEEAAAAAAGALKARLCTSPAQHPLRVLSLGSRVARAPAQRALQQRLQQAGFGSIPLPGLPPLWCIQRSVPPASSMETPALEQLAGRQEVLVGLQLQAGCPPPPAAARQLGPTAMPPDLAALSASLAGVQPGSTVLDPFCGTASLLVAALQRGAAVAVGSDIDATHFAPLASGSCTGGGSSSGGRVGGGSSDGLEGSRGSSSGGSGSGAGLPILLQADAAGLHRWLPPGSIDCILTDLPYGYRTAVEADGAVTEAGGAIEAGSTESGSATAEAGSAAAEAGEESDAGGAETGWERLLGVLLRLAAHVLEPQGRLLTWLPAQRDAAQQEERLRRAGRRQRLRLLRFLPESRQRGYPRAVALFELEGGPEISGHANLAVSGAATRRPALLAALRAAAEAQPVHNLPPPAPPLSVGEAVAAQPGQPPGLEAAAKAAQRIPAGDVLGSFAAATEAASCGAVERRGLPYREARRAAAGAAIDVWRWGAGACPAARLPCRSGWAVASCLGPALPPEARANMKPAPTAAAPLLATRHVAARAGAATPPQRSRFSPCCR
jgi:hypothetical protein